MVRCCEDRNLLETKRFSLPYTELKCLLLFKGEKYLTVKGMALKLDVAKSRMTKLVDSLLKKGPGQQDRRPQRRQNKLISLSTKGKAVADEIESSRNVFTRKSFSSSKPRKEQR